MIKTRHTAGEPAYISTLSNASIEAIIASIKDAGVIQGFLSEDQEARLLHYQREHGRRVRAYRKQGVLP